MWGEGLFSLFSVCCICFSVVIFSSVFCFRFCVYICFLFLFSYCHNLPFSGRAMQGSRGRLPREENTQSRHQRLFGENIGKTEMCGLRTLCVKGSGVVFINDYFYFLRIEENLESF